MFQQVEHESLARLFILFILILGIVAAFGSQLLGNGLYSSTQRAIIGKNIPTTTVPDTEKTGAVATDTKPELIPPSRPSIPMQVRNGSKEKNPTVLPEPENASVEMKGFQGARERPHQGYLIELNQKPLAEKYAEYQTERKTGEEIKQELDAYRRALLAEHSQVKEQLAAAIGENKIRQEFFNVFNGFSIDATEKELAGIRGIKAVFPNLFAELLLMDSVPLINADDVWKLNSLGKPCQQVSKTGISTNKECLTGKGIRIGIIDTGVDYTHPDLGGCSTEQFLVAKCKKVVGGFDFGDNDPDPMDEHGHGTHVAAIAAGKSPATVAYKLYGVAPDASIFAYKVSGRTRPSTMDNVIAAIDASTDPNGDRNFSDHLDVISLSVGMICGTIYDGNCGPDDPASQAIDRAVNIGITAVVAAGNSGHSNEMINWGKGRIVSPAAARNAIAVAASTKQDTMAPYSSNGPIVTESFGLFKPDITAPGSQICAAEWDSAWQEYRCIDDRHVSISGTSMATPHVSGTAALLKQKNPSWGPKEIKMALRNTARNLGESVFIQGYGRIDALQATLSKKPPWVRVQTGGNVARMVTVVGTVNADDLVSYSVYYGNGIEPDNWQLIAQGNEPVNESVLLSGFDTGKYSDGFNNFRLVGRARSGASSEDRSIVNVNNIRLDINRFQEFQNNQTIEIRGSTDTHGFGRYTLEVALGSFDENGLSFSGPFLLAESYSPVINGVLGNWDLQGIPKDSYYQLVLRVFDTNKHLHGSESRTVYIENAHTMHEGWPVTLESQGSKSSFGAPQNSGLQELFFANRFQDDPAAIIPNFYGFLSNGLVLNGWPVGFTTTGSTDSSPAIGDLERNKSSEIVIVSDGNLFVFNLNGNLLFSYNPPNNGGGEMTPTLADLDNDQQLEIIYAAQRAKEGGVTRSLINAVKSDGNGFDGYPIEVLGTVNGQAVGDVDRDGNTDIVFFQTGLEDEKIRLVVLSGRDQRIVASTEVSGNSATMPVLADLDHDSQLEIVVAVQVNENSAMLYAFRSDGSIYPGWPQQLEPSVWSAVWYEMFQAPSMGDIDHDGYLEIFFADWMGWVYGWHYNGTNIAGWPFEGYPKRYGTEFNDEMGSYFISTQPLIADVDNDNEPEIVVQSKYLHSNMVMALKANGSMANGFPKQLIGNSCAPYSSTPMIADIDSDNRLELVAHSEANVPCIGTPVDSHITVKAWDLNASSGETALQWPKFQYNAQNTGCYQCSN